MEKLRGREKLEAKKARTRCHESDGIKALKRSESVVTEEAILKSCDRGAASEDKSQHVARNRWLPCSKDEGLSR